MMAMIMMIMVEKKNAIDDKPALEVTIVGDQ